ncbi:SPW repeat protein [Halorussus caseinilyticus]|uniref:SPW repeat protein n=1 Tax=Halorussus caseinilyticus TaxID=3034025 RepID=UPI0023E8EA16|nr:SPW repeat protein [Halorussus sp. DT72]
MSETTTANQNDTSGYISAATALVGGWIVISAFVYSPPAANFWNDIIVGAAIGVIAGYNAFKADDPGGINTGSASLVALLGLWMVIAPFVFETVLEAAFWSDIVSGAIVAVLAGYNAYRSRGTERRAPTAEAETR